MSQLQINLSPDLKKLRDEGYNINIQSGYLCVRHVPYVNSHRQVKLGTLVSKLDLAGNVTTKPSTHVVFFIGDYPCDRDGIEIAQIKHQSVEKELAEGLSIQHSFSNKPKAGYSNYYEKMTTYITIISSPAQSIDPSATAKSFPVIEAEDEESVFTYIDTASSRAEIDLVTKKLALDKVAIVGLGGTGAYVLDLIAKTPINEIHLYDRDKFLQHNAFRAPGAASIEELRQEWCKVDYYQHVYSRMHRNIFAHNTYVDASNVDQLQKMNFVFLCLDNGEAKRVIVEKLNEAATPFIDVGMGIQLVDDKLLGVLRVTTSTVDKHKHVRDNGRISFSGDDGNNDYTQNVQIADLNALNAALAVVKWKKLFGFYADFEKEHFSTYTIDGNNLINEEQL